jgi:F-type H+-transporting ATPase subunit delta
MSNQTSIARPYAKAIFEHAEATNELSVWSECLSCFAQLMTSEQLVVLLKNPTLEIEAQVDILVTLGKKLIRVPPKHMSDFIRLLIVNKRLFVLPEIAKIYEKLKAERERTLVVEVSSFTALTSQQKQRLTDALSRRLNRGVTLVEKLDASLLGGAVIRADHLVIDASVKGQLLKLAATLAA